MSIYDLKVKNRNNEDVSLSDFKGKVLIIVNTATGCGFTPQYEGLEKLYKKYHDKGLEILDFPCNQFGKQAPGDDNEIHEFCTLTYNTTFPRFSKIDVNGEEADPLFKFLKENAKEDSAPVGLKNKMAMGAIAKISTTCVNPEDIKWNFTKFLVDREGNVVGRFGPTSVRDEIEVEIKKYL
jgi:glutathione peroxidase